MWRMYLLYTIIHFEPSYSTRNHNPLRRPNYEELSNPHRKWPNWMIKTAKVHRLWADISCPWGWPLLEPHLAKSLGSSGGNNKRETTEVKYERQQEIMVFIANTNKTAEQERNFHSRRRIDSFWVKCTSTSLVEVSAWSPGLLFINNVAPDTHTVAFT
jgi:hypothetical protein